MGFVEGTRTKCTFHSKRKKNSNSKGYPLNSWNDEVHIWLHIRMYLYIKSLNSDTHNGVSWNTPKFFKKHLGKAPKFLQ